jgi:hypothetical protein
LKEGRIIETRDHLELYDSVGKLDVGPILAQSQLNKDSKYLVALIDVSIWEVGLINLPFLEVLKEKFLPETSLDWVYSCNAMFVELMLYNQSVLLTGNGQLLHVIIYKVDSLLNRYSGHSPL